MSVYATPVLGEIRMCMSAETGEDRQLLRSSRCHRPHWRLPEVSHALQRGWHWCGSAIALMRSLGVLQEVQHGGYCDGTSSP